VSDPRPPRPHAAAGRVLAVVAAVAVLAGCSLFRDDEPAASSSVEPTTTGAPHATRPEVAAPTIQLLDPGREPRQLLRYQPSAGATTLTVRTGLTIRQEGASSRPVEVAIPTVVHRIEATLEEPVGDRYDFRLRVLEAHLAKAAGLPAADRTAADQRLEELVGLTGSGSLTADGRLRGFAWDGLDELGAQVRTTVGELAVQLPGLIAPLPGAAVGPGARWQATSTVLLDGVPSSVRTTYTFTGMLGTGVAYTSTSETATAERPLPDGVLSSGSGTVESSRSSVTAEGTIDLAGLFGTTLLAGTADQAIRLDLPDGPVTLDQTISTLIEVETER